MKKKRSASAMNRPRYVLSHQRLVFVFCFEIVALPGRLQHLGRRLGSRRSRRGHSEKNNKHKVASVTVTNKREKMRLSRIHLARRRTASRQGKRKLQRMRQSRRSASLSTLQTPNIKWTLLHLYEKRSSNHQRLQPFWGRTPDAMDHSIAAHWRSTRLTLTLTGGNFSPGLVRRLCSTVARQLFFSTSRRM